MVSGIALQSIALTVAVLGVFAASLTDHNLETARTMLLPRWCWQNYYVRLPAGRRILPSSAWGGCSPTHLAARDIPIGRHVPAHLICSRFKDYLSHHFHYPQPCGTWFCRRLFSRQPWQKSKRPSFLPGATVSPPPAVAPKPRSRTLTKLQKGGAVLQAQAPF